MEQVRREDSLESNKILEVKKLYKSFIKKGGFLKEDKIDEILKEVDFYVKKGEILGIVGESGCGKSTISNIIVKLIKADKGHIIFNGEDITNLEERKFRRKRFKIQLISQNPYKSFNPKFSIEEIMLEGPMEHFEESKEEIIKRAKKILNDCGLPDDAIFRYPHEFSGGQLQRIAIARSLIMQPDLILADEIVSALDMSTQAEILKLLLKLKQENKLSIVFISHDLGVIRKISDRILVMKKGRIVDMGDKGHIFHKTNNEYTKKLIDAIPYFKY